MKIIKSALILACSSTVAVASLMDTDDTGQKQNGINRTLSVAE
jgi:hypothetical protein